MTKTAISTILLIAATAAFGQTANQMPEDPQEKLVRLERQTEAAKMVFEQARKATLDEVLVLERILRDSKNAEPKNQKLWNDLIGHELSIVDDLKTKGQKKMNDALLVLIKALEQSRVAIPRPDPGSRFYAIGLEQFLVRDEEFKKWRKQNENMDWRFPRNYFPVMREAIILIKTGAAKSSALSLLRLEEEDQ